MKKKIKKKIRTIGRCEYIDLPELGLYQVEAKIDTGAYSCAIHVSLVEEFTIEGKSFLLVYIFKNSHFSPDNICFEFHDYKLKSIKSSNGMVEKRYVVNTRVLLKNKKVKTSFTLTNRSDMKYPILLGRKFLNKRFLVDVSKKFSVNEKPIE